MLRLLSTLCLLASPAALAQACPNGYCGGYGLEATVTPAQFQGLRASVASLAGRYRSASEPCDKLVKILARAKTPDSIFSSTTLVTVSEGFFPVDLNTGTAKLLLRFNPSTLGLSCLKQVYALKDDALWFANLTIAE